MTRGFRAGCPDGWAPPTERMATEKQMELIVAVAALGGERRLPVEQEIVARRASLSPSTMSGVRAFFEQTGLIEPGRGTWAVTEAGLRFARLRAVDSARSRLVLRDLWRGQWFEQAALDLLQDGPLEEGVLADRLGEGLPGRRERWIYLVEWLVHALIVHRDNGLITAPGNTLGAAADSGGARADRPVIFDPLMAMEDEELAALPTDRFVALMDTYRALFTSLTPPPAAT
ncbi:hypothetical protein [Streptomyces sp. NPDC014744]|uniref:hypothetical protein n=1 Tax=Streptomyces sp. NPDC014744 TaxID=3364903 RepID=UPI0036F7EC91